MARTGWVTNALCREHDPGRAHPESPARLAAIETRLAASGLADELDRREASPAPVPALERVHAPGYVERVERAIRGGADFVDTPDANVSARSFDAALVAAGGALDAVDRVMTGDWRNAFVAARPPGHHAERDLAMGFCLFNNVAVVARHLQAEHGLARVAILDWDVHHGNGTQHIFERDPSVFYASLHQFPHYPGTGAIHERGLGDGEGATLNCPLPPGSGDVEWLAAFEGRVLPALEAFDPEFLLVSAGFDAHEDDPLSGTRVTVDAFDRMTRLALDLAAARCEGRLVGLLEGGYDLDALAASVETHVAGLASA